MTDDIKEHIVNEALNIVTGARRKAYGKPENNFARICTMWMAYFKIKGWVLMKRTPTDPDYASVEATLQPLDVAAMMRLMKEARLAETQDHLDSYQDIVGYALCGAECAGVEVPVDDKMWSDAQYVSMQRAYEARIDKLMEDMRDLSARASWSDQVKTQLHSHASTDPAAASSQDAPADPTTPAP